MKIYTMRSPTVDRVLQVLIGILFVALVYVVTDGIREPVVVVGDTAVTPAYVHGLSPLTSPPASLIHCRLISRSKSTMVFLGRMMRGV